MRTLWAILLGGLVLVGTAEARLGESIEQIESRIGSLELKADEDYPNDLVFGTCKNRGGFDEINFIFFKNKISGSGPSKTINSSDVSGGCVGIKYMKKYFTWDETGMSTKDAHELIDKNFSASSSEMQLRISEGISRDSETKGKWRLGWLGPRGETALARVSEDEGDLRPVFGMIVWTASLAKFYQNKSNAEQKAKENYRQKEMDAL